MKRTTILLSLALGCGNASTCSNGTCVSIQNTRTTATTVYVSFGADSKITAADWLFCEGTGLTCSFPLAAKTTDQLPNPTGAYLNATFSFDAPVGCGVTKAEVNVNNPSWYDILDVSLVDGYSNSIEITSGSTTLGPVTGETGNEKVYGVYPYGCDICVERQNPPCGIAKGKQGCQTGTQYDPDVPCQWQGTTKGGGGESVTVSLL